MLSGKDFIILSSEEAVLVHWALALIIRKNKAVCVDLQRMQEIGMLDLATRLRRFCNDT